jgi:hypothetical protein
MKMRKKQQQMHHLYNILEEYQSFIVTGVGKKVKQSHYRPGQAQRVPGG